MTSKFTSLEEFLYYILDNEELMDKAKTLDESDFEDNLNGVKGFRKYYLYRDDEYQVQIFSCPPNFCVPEHTHPNVDSYEVFLGGAMVLSHSGHWLMGEYESKYFMHNDYYCVQVRPNDPHGGITGPKGGRFMSIQRWINGVKPSCVGSDYNGLTVSEKHLGDITCGKVSYKKQLTFRDAATLEKVKPEFEFDENGEVCDVYLPEEVNS